MIPISGTRCLRALTARGTRPAGLKASRPSGVFFEDSITGKIASTGMPKSLARSATGTSRSIEYRNTPGIDGTSTVMPDPSVTKTGYIRSFTDNVCSLTKERDQGSLRFRRILVAGNLEFSIATLITLPVKWLIFSIFCLRHIIDIDDLSSPASPP